MANVYVGEGALAGRGVYATRFFAEGEVVVPYHLRQVSREKFLTLPETERLFVHSYWGERYVYPAPARYVNHSDSPNTHQDFEKRCHIALRPIAEGELITTDATKETDRELTTFLFAYEAAVKSGDHRKLDVLIDDQAVVWLPGQVPQTKTQIADAFRRAAVDHPDGLSLAIRDVSWIIGTGRWEAVCSYDFELRDSPATCEDRSAGHVTDVLKIVEGNWQIIYRHVSHP